MLRMHLSLALLPLLASCISGTELATATRQRDFDYFVFVRQWAGSFCHTSSSCPLVHRHGFRFTIHGLWPNYDDGTWPEFCDRDEPFDEDKLKDIMGQLEEEWPSFMNENDGFWSHEWARHGTCAAKVLHDEHEYFKTVLRLQHDYDIADALVQHGIKTSDSHKYKRTDIEKAIRDFYKVDAMVHCDSKGELSEIWMCIGKDLKPFDCKSQGSERCDEVLIPSLGGDKDDSTIAGDQSDQSDQASDDVMGLANGLLLHTRNNARAYPYDHAHYHHGKQPAGHERGGFNDKPSRKRLVIRILVAALAAVMLAATTMLVLRRCKFMERLRMCCSVAEDSDAEAKQPLVGSDVEAAVAEAK